MKRKMTGIILAAIFIAAGAMAQTGAAKPAAQQTGPAGTKIGVIQIQQAIAATNEGMRDLEALQKKFVEPKQAELQKLKTEIDDLTKQLNTQGDKLNDDARNTLVKNLDQKQKLFQRSGEDAQAELQNQQNDIMQRIGGKMMGIIDKYAKDNGYAVIVDVSSQNTPVLWAAQANDVTQTIVDAYNVVSNVPPPPAPPAAKPTAGGANPAARKP